MLVKREPAVRWVFNYNATGRLKGMQFAGPKESLEWRYGYSEAGLLKERKTPWHPIWLSHDLGGHITGQHVGLLLSQTAEWSSDGKLQVSRLKRGDTPTKSALCIYNPQGRLIKEGILVGAELNEVTFAGYTFDWGSNAGLGIRTGAQLRDSRNSAKQEYRHAILEPESGDYKRPEVEKLLGLTSQRLLPEALPVEKPWIDINALLGLRTKDAKGESSGDKQLSEDQEETLSTRYDAMGRVIERTFKESGQKQLLEWSPQGYLLGVTLKNAEDVVLSTWKA